MIASEIPLQMNDTKKRPVVLLILDGWGVAPPSDGNAITKAKTPQFDKLLSNYPVMTLLASGESVGLDLGQPGNCAIGHKVMGTGQIMLNNLSYIDSEIKGGGFAKNEVLQNALLNVKQKKSALHLFGLLSENKRYSNIDHLFAFISAAKDVGLKKIYLHIILDGKNVPKDSGIHDLQKLEKRLDDIGVGEIVTVCGQYYGMDDTFHWDRTKKAYDAIYNANSQNNFKDTIGLMEYFYQKKIYDEMVEPSVIIKNKRDSSIKENDCLICFNLNPLSCIQLFSSFTVPGFIKFDRKNFHNNTECLALTEQNISLPIRSLFSKRKSDISLTEIISTHGMKQLYIAETLGFSGITFYFEGEKYKIRDNVTRVLISSEKVKDYEQFFEMKNNEVVERFIKEFSGSSYNFTVCNLVSANVIAETKDFNAVIKSVEAIDRLLPKIVNAVLSKDGILIITSDHGNIENLVNLQTLEFSYENTGNPVPFIAVSNDFEGKSSQNEKLISNDLSLLTPAGSLLDVAPSILGLLGIEKSPLMKGRDLLEKI